MGEDEVQRWDCETKCLSQDKEGQERNKVMMGVSDASLLLTVSLDAWRELLYFKDLRSEWTEAVFLTYRLVLLCGSDLQTEFCLNKIPVWQKVC